MSLRAAMNAMPAYDVRAYNTAATSENKIHDDAIAQKFGFTGALVPGVEVYAWAKPGFVRLYASADRYESGGARTSIVTPTTTSMTCHVRGCESFGASARAPRPSPVNHTRLAVIAPPANHQRPTTPCWLAMLPSMSTVSR